MNLTIVNYLNEHKDKFSKEVLVSELLKSGYKKEEIDEAVSFVYSSVASPKIPQAGLGDFRFAGFWRRWLAVFIDGIILSIIYFLINSIMDDFAPLYFLMGWVYNIFMINQFGATIGKNIVGIKVIGEDGSKPSLGNIAIRETFGKLISGVVLGIGYFVMVFSEKKQTWHDKLAKTIVVYK